MVSFQPAPTDCGKEGREEIRKEDCGKEGREEIRKEDCGEKASMSQHKAQEALNPSGAREQPFDYNKRLDELSSKISEIVRSSSLGLIAVAWLGLSATNSSAELVKRLNDGWLMAGAALSLIALLLDFSQYVFGYFAVLGDKRSKSSDPHRRSCARNFRFFCFYGKIVFAVLSSATVIIAVFSAIFRWQLWF